MNRSIMLRRSFNTTYRSFTTTARRFCPSNDKPPPQERNDPQPPPPNEPKPSENGLQEPKAKENEELKSAAKDLRETFLGTFQPRSEHFLFAFANPRLSKEKRTKSGLLLLAATLLGLLTEPYFKKAMLEPHTSASKSEEEAFLKMIVTASANRDETNEDPKTSR